MNFSAHIDKLLSVGHYQAPRGFVRGRTIPQGQENIELILNGEVRFEIDGTPRDCGCGWLFWHLPGEMTVHENNYENPYECLTINFETAAPRRHIPRACFWANSVSVRVFADEVLRAYHDNSYDNRQLGDYIYSRLLWVAYLHTRDRSTSALPLDLQELLGYIEKNLAADLSVARLTETIDKSPSYIHALFLSEIKTTPHRYINQRRMQLARRLLASNDQPIKEVALTCGFVNIETFNRCFKRFNSVAPGEYRMKFVQP